jgi:hypothetical protein
MEEVGSPDEGLDMRSRDSFEKLERLPLVGPGAPQRGGSSGEGPSLYSWHHATLIIVGEVLGTGIMGLPSAMVPLGWVCGLGSCVLFAGTAVYSGVLLSRVRSMYPGGALGYADVAHRLFGRRFGCFTNCAILFNWFFLLPYYLMAAANGLVIAFFDVDACYYQWAALVMGGLFPAMQVRRARSHHRRPAITHPPHTRPRQLPISGRRPCKPRTRHGAYRGLKKQQQQQQQQQQQPVWRGTEVTPPTFARDARTDAPICLSAYMSACADHGCAVCARRRSARCMGCGTPPWSRMRWWCSAS